MEIHLRLDNDEDAGPSGKPLIFKEKAEAVLADALEALTPRGSLPDRVEISLSLITADLMRERNSLFRGVDEATDVLSFPMWEEEGEFRPSRLLPTLTLGDILICPEVVRRSSTSDEEFLAEMTLLLAHGFLHLLAWDHDTVERRVAMEQATAQIRDELLKAPAFGLPEQNGEVLK